MLVALLLLCGALAAQPKVALAETVYTNGGTHYVISEDGTITITEYFGMDESVSIPDQIGNFPVTTIASGAFEGSTVTQLEVGADVQLERGAVDSSTTVTRRSASTGDSSGTGSQDAGGTGSGTSADAGGSGSASTGGGSQGNGSGGSGQGVQGGGSTSAGAASSGGSDGSGSVSSGDSDSTGNTSSTSSTSSSISDIDATQGYTVYLQTDSGSVSLTPRDDGSYADEQGNTYTIDSTGQVLDGSGAVVADAQLVEEAEGLWQDSALPQSARNVTPVAIALVVALLAAAAIAAGILLRKRK